MRQFLGLAIFGGGLAAIGGIVIGTAAFFNVFMRMMWDMVPGSPPFDETFTMYLISLFTIGVVMLIIGLGLVGAFVIMMIMVARAE